MTERNREGSTTSAPPVLPKKPLKSKSAFKPQLQSLPECEYADPIDAVKRYTYTFNIKQTCSNCKKR